MHQKESKRILAATAALIMTAAFVTALIVLVGADAGAVGMFLIFVLLGWFVTVQAFRWADRRDSRERTDEAPRAETTPKAATVPKTRPVAPSPAVLSLEPSAVLQRLSARASTTGEVVSASLWIEDPPTATLRIVSTVGTMSLHDTSLSSEDGPAAKALASASPVFVPAADVTDDLGSKRVWRLVLPIDAADSRGVAIVDLVPGDTPDVEGLLLATALFRGTLVGTLTLIVARQETETASDLVEVARRLARCTDSDAVLECALDYAMSMSSAASASVMLLDDEDKLRIVRSNGLPQAILDGTTTIKGEGIAGWVLASGKPLLVDDLPTREGLSYRRGVCSAVSVPIADEQGILGVLNVRSRTLPARFTRSHMESIDALGRQVCVAYRNALALDTTRNLYLSTLKTLAMAIQRKEPSSLDSTDRVLDLVVALGQEMELDENDMLALEIAALFHDMGMVAACSGVAQEDRPLTTVERGLLKMHPVIAAEVISEAPALKDVAPIVYHHHERFDGRGYVGGLAGAEIPVGARVLAVVDAYAAMTSRRPYRPELTPAEAVKELRDNAGTQFDPEVVERFIDILRTERTRARDAASS